MPVLAGVTDTSSFTTTTQFLGSADEWISRGQDTTTALLTYSAVAGTAETIGVYIPDPWTVGNAKMVLTDGSGNILGTTASVDAGGWVDGWNDVAFVSTFVLADSDPVVPWIAVESGNLKLYGTGQIDWTNQHTLGTYASPDDPLTVDAVSAHQEFAMRVSGELGGGASVFIPGSRQINRRRSRRYR